MGRSLNRIVVIDVESTCWEKQTYQKNEIIEIGITELAFNKCFASPLLLIGILYFCAKAKSLSS